MCLYASLPLLSSLFLPPSPALHPFLLQISIPTSSPKVLDLSIATPQHKLPHNAPTSYLPTCSSRDASLCSVEPDLFTWSMSSSSTMVSTLKEDKWTNETPHPPIPDNPTEPSSLGVASHFNTVSYHLKVSTTHICIMK